MCKIFLFDIENICLLKNTGEDTDSGLCFTEETIMEFKPYEHKVHYYETDKMGVVHHSNYIRWMEEARVDMMEKSGFGYKRLEEEGIISPVLGIECEYKKSTDFDDTIVIAVEEEFYNGIKMTIKYTMTNKATGAVTAVGKSRHCFLNKDGRPVNLRKLCPELDGIFNSLLVKES